jgi:putative phage-type endonuclease
MQKFIRIDSLEQGSPDWHEWRRTVIGASDAPVLMGENPWRSVEDLCLEKAGKAKPFGGNSFTRKGQQLEPVARTALSRQLGLSLQTTVIQSREYPWLAASLDGLDESMSVVVEIKCGEKAHRHLEGTGSIPTYYIGQLQHILLVTGFDYIYYYSFLSNTEKRLIKVTRDLDYQSRLLKAASRFVERMKTSDSPLRTTIFATGIEAKDQSAGLLPNPADSKVGAAFVVKKFPSSEYFGQWKNDGPNEVGVLRYAERDILGLWAGSWTGRLTAVVRDSPSTVKVGEFEKLELNGPGGVFVDGQYSILGQFQEGEVHGFGISESSDGTVYAGQFVKGLPNGWGIKKYDDGGRYIGQWENNMRHGKGTFQSSGEYPSVYEGEWVKDEIDGFGRISFCDDAYESDRDAPPFEVGSYKGHFRKGKFHGDGVWTWSRDLFLRGKWRDGVPFGAAELICLCPDDDYYFGCPPIMKFSLKFVDGRPTELSFRSFQESPYFKGLKEHASRLLALHTETADFSDKLGGTAAASISLINSSGIKALLSKIDITLAGWDESLDEFEENIFDVIGELLAPFSNILELPDTGRAICLNIDKDLEKAFDARAQLYELYQYLIDSQKEHPSSKS